MGIRPGYVKRSRAVRRLDKITTSFLSTILRLPLAMALFGAGCADEGPAGEAVFDLPRDGSEVAFFDLPWPSDVRRGEDGMVDVRAFPNPMRIGVLSAYLEAISTRLDGFGTNGAAYFRFTETVEEGSLPVTPAETTLPDASVFLIDVDPDSPERGTRHPAVVHYRDEPTIYWPEHTLAVRPVYGMPLAGGRTYAAVVTRDVRPVGGGRFRRSADFAELVDGGGDAAVEAARAVYGPALEAIEEAGVPREHLLSLAVFTTHDPTAGLVAVRDWMMDSYPTPEGRDDAWRFVPHPEEDRYTLVRGRYGPVPLFQSGEAPYETPDSGEIRFEDGVPVVQDEVDLRFALTVPTTPMPADGYPIVLYAHGTGGDYETFVRNGVAGDLAAEGFAVLGIDQVLHGERNPSGSSPEYLFFNFENPYAARDNVRQAVIDVVQQARFAANLQIPTRIVNVDGEPVRFDPTRIYVYGHSQGGLNMPIFLAIDDQARGGVLSGAGATLAISIIEKKEPLDILLVVKLVLRLPGGTTDAAVEREHFVYEHPVLTVLQSWIDAGDGANYGHLLFDTPREGFAPKSILQTEGLLDLYTTPHSVEALAAASRIPLVEPVAQPVEALELRGIEPVTAPVEGNVAGGMATAGLVQFPDDGHFAAFDNEVARAQIRGFFRSFEDSPIPVIPAP